MHEGTVTSKVTRLKIPPPDQTFDNCGILTWKAAVAVEQCFLRNLFFRPFEYQLSPARNSIPGSSTKLMSACPFRSVFALVTRSSVLQLLLKSNSCSYSFLLSIMICSAYLCFSPTIFKVPRVLYRLCRPCQVYLFLARRLTMCKLSRTFTIS